MSANVMRCPRCGNRDDLVLAEAHEEWGETNPGRIEIDDQGALIPPSDFFFGPGNPIVVLILCDNCDHQWRPRRQSVSTLEAQA